MTEILMQAVPVHPTNPKAIWCEHCEVWCRSESAFIHHKKGRGKYHNDVNTWLSVCRSCHNWIELNPIEAEELGLSIKRI